MPERGGGTEFARKGAATGAHDIEGRSEVGRVGAGIAWNVAVNQVIVRQGDLVDIGDAFDRILLHDAILFEDQVSDLPDGALALQVMHQVKDGILSLADDGKVCARYAVKNGSTDTRDKRAAERQRNVQATDAELLHIFPAVLHLIGVNANPEQIGMERLYCLSKGRGVVIFEGPVDETDLVPLLFQQRGHVHDAERGVDCPDLVSSLHRWNNE